jgi:hypothetical protein
MFAKSAPKGSITNEFAMESPEFSTFLHQKQNNYELTVGGES